MSEMTGASQKACSGPRVLGGMHRGGRSHIGGQGLEEDTRSQYGTQRAELERDGEGCLAQLRSPGLHPSAKGIMWVFELRSMGQARPVASGMKSRLKGRRGQRPVRARAEGGQEARGWEEQDP